MQNYAVELKDVNFDEALKDCYICQQAKMKRKPCKTSREKAVRPFYRIHMDIMGPINVKAITTKRRFVLVIVDDYSHFTYIYAMTKKSETMDCYTQYIKEVEREFDGKFKLRKIRTDLGSEFTSQEFKNLNTELNVEIEYAEKATPEHNRYAERFIRSIQEKTRALLFDSGLPKKFWEIAMSYANEIYNRTPHAAIKFKSPYEKWIGKPPSLELLKRFGCLAAMKNLNVRNFKFNPRNENDKLFFVGITKTGSRLFDIKTRKIHDVAHTWICENVVFKDIIQLNDPEFRIWDMQEEMTESLNSEGTSNNFLNLENNELTQLTDENQSEQNTVNEDDFDIEEIEVNCIEDEESENVNLANFITPELMTDIDSNEEPTTYK